MDSFMQEIREVVVNCRAGNSYTTCMWHNLVTCRILYDKNGRLTAYQKQYTTPYPQQLRKNIIEHQLRLIDSSMPAYPVQIKKALQRRDLVSVNHRVSEFLASYFDLLFALNERAHPGEKRLIQLCRQQCSLLPRDFEENLQALFHHMFEDGAQAECARDLERIVENVKEIAAC